MKSISIIPQTVRTNPYFIAKSALFIVKLKSWPLSHHCIGFEPSIETNGGGSGQGCGGNWPGSTRTLLLLQKQLYFISYWSVLHKTYRIGVKLDAQTRNSFCHPTKRAHIRLKVRLSSFMATILVKFLAISINYWISV